MVENWVVQYFGNLYPVQKYSTLWYPQKNRLEVVTEKYVYYSTILETAVYIEKHMIYFRVNYIICIFLISHALCLSCTMTWAPGRAINIAIISPHFILSLGQRICNLTQPKCIYWVFGNQSATSHIGKRRLYKICHYSQVKV